MRRLIAPPSTTHRVAAGAQRRMPTSRTAMKAVSPAQTPPRPQCQCSAARLSGAKAHTAATTVSHAHERDVARADQHAVEGEHDAGRRQHADEPRPQHVGLVLHRGVDG